MTSKIFDVAQARFEESTEQTKDGGFLCDRADETTSLWYRFEELTPRTPANRLALGQCFHELRNHYSDRNSGGVRLTIHHGSFEEEIRKRGYKPRTVREWISDYDAALAGKPLAAQRHKARRVRRSRVAPTDAIAEFARLLPFTAAQAAYREAAKLLHPDRGGDTNGMQQLNLAWDRAKDLYRSVDVRRASMQAIVRSE